MPALTTTSEYNRWAGEDVWSDIADVDDFGSGHGGKPFDGQGWGEVVSRGEGDASVIWGTGSDFNQPDVGSDLCVI